MKTPGQSVFEKLSEIFDSGYAKWEHCKEMHAVCNSIAQAAIEAHEAEQNQPVTVEWLMCGTLPCHRSTLNTHVIQGDSRSKKIMFDNIDEKLQISISADNYLSFNIKTRPLIVTGKQIGRAHV